MPPLRSLRLGGVFLTVMTLYNGFVGSVEKERRPRRHGLGVKEKNMRKTIRKSLDLTFTAIRDMMDEYPYFFMVFTGLLSCFMLCASVLKILKMVSISWGEVLLPLGGVASIIAVIFIGCLVHCARPVKAQ